ncbi:MAG: SpoIID/LytB domain-containing protein [Leptolyngbya sp. SIO1D8]|nr:SpoIID/LytB domain-containing protein [Leptolyngbya sp. SIO1D8]
MAVQFQKEWQRIQRLFDRTEPKLRSRLTFASGALLSGALMLRLMPLPGIGNSTELEPLQTSLWRSTGMVRQSVIDLYRIQRSRQTSETASSPAETQTETQAETDTETNTAAQTNTATNSTPAQQQAPQASAPVAALTNDTVIDSVLEMRVAIARNVPSLTVGANTLSWVMNTDGSAHCEIPAQTSLTAYPAGQGIHFEGCELSSAVWLEADAGGYVFVEDSWYRGRILLFNNGGQLLAVNFVLLGEYLASVVGSEMYHHWPLEAFKAQAVAARSYALTHHVRPASDYFDLDNTQRFQAYKGIAMETTGTQQAVAETAGEFISYQGGIVESLYAASDQIVQEAHGGQGMSQHGAKDYAVQGFGYEQILGIYYPGTSLARLVVE